jgi:hypothetical protein
MRLAVRFSSESFERGDNARVGGVGRKFLRAETIMLRHNKPQIPLYLPKAHPLSSLSNDLAHLGVQFQFITQRLTCWTYTLALFANMRGSRKVKSSVTSSRTSEWRAFPEKNR